MFRYSNFTSHKYGFPINRAAAHKLEPSCETTLLGKPKWRATEWTVVFRFPVQTNLLMYR